MSILEGQDRIEAAKKLGDAFTDYAEARRAHDVAAEAAGLDWVAYGIIWRDNLDKCAMSLMKALDGYLATKRSG